MSGPKKSARMRVFRRDKWKCQSCGVKVKSGLPDGTPNLATIEHIVPRSKEGKHGLDNLVTFCYVCNAAENRLRHKMGFR